MKRSIASYVSAALVSTVLAFIVAPAPGENVFQIPAINIPNSSILPNNKVEPVPLYIGQPARQATRFPIKGLSTTRLYKFASKENYNEDPTLSRSRAGLAQLGTVGIFSTDGT